MEQVGGENMGQRVQMWKVAAASLAGASLEWYDFQLYGFLTAIAFNRLFFPTSNPLIGTLIAFVSFGVGFAMRPIGSIVFGHFGDKIGRKSMLIITILIIGLSTFFIGLLPTYESIGIWAPILLVSLRLIEGFGLGGEFGGASLMIVEHSPNDKRGFWGSWAGMGNPTGQLLALVVVLIFVASLSNEQFLSWGWRVPYLLSIFILVAGLYVRLKVTETPAFKRMQETRTESRIPLVDLFRTHPIIILKAFGARVADAGTSGVFSAFGIAYVTTSLGLPRATALIGVAIGLVGQMICIPVVGRLSDRFGRRPMIMLGSAWVALLIFPSFLLMNTAQPVLVWVAYLIGWPVGTSLIFAPVGAYLPELFETQVRFTGTSVVFQLSALVAGFIPAIATVLLAAGGGNPWLIAVFIVVLAIITFASASLLPETFRKNLSETKNDTSGMVRDS